MENKSLKRNLPRTSVFAQIIHIEGQRKGDIDHFRHQTITIGRDPKCDVVFPADLLIVSRVHAKIRWDGDQYILKNLSTNGCYINGKKMEESALKAGDVIAFADDGPKISFLYEKTPETTVEFTSQYGTVTKSFRQNSVHAGKDASNDFAINHSRILHKHAEFFFTNNQPVLKPTVLDIFKSVLTKKL